MVFEDRTEAGRELAKRLKAYAKRQDVVVLGVPRGGVPVACEVAMALGVPWEDEQAFGAIASGGIRVLDEEIVWATGITPGQIEQVEAVEKQEVARRERAYRGGRPPLDVKGKTVILVDDGVATGSTLEAGIRALRKMKPARLVVAIPVGPPKTCGRLKSEVDELVCLEMPESFCAIGQFYIDFTPVEDEEVTEVLGRSAAMGSAAGKR